MAAVLARVYISEPQRKRKRKAKDQATFDAITTAIVADLCHFHLSNPDTNLGLTLSRANKVLGEKDRYKPPYYNKTTVAALDLLCAPELGYVKQTIGTALDFSTGRRLQTTIRPGKALVSVLKSSNLDLSDFTISADAEVIVLKAYAPKSFGDTKVRNAGPIAYKDTATTNRYRAEVQAINRWLSEADISFDRREAVKTGIEPLSVDISNRRLTRIFTRGQKTFDSGGRLFGGFWQTLPKSVRLKGLRLNGEPVESLDYSALNPRIAYGLAGHKLPKSDPYAIRGFEKNRDGVKKIFNAMLFVSKPLGRWPEETKELFPAGTTVRKVTAAILKAHPELSKLFHTEIGHHIQFLESQIMVAVLLQLKAKGLLGLPVHDAVVVPRSATKEAEVVLLRQFKRISGISGLVSQETS